MLDREDIEEFKQIWRAEYGEELSDDIAVAHATNLMTMMDKIYRRTPMKWIDTVIAKEAQKY